MLGLDATPLLTEKAVAVVARVTVRREERGAMVEVGQVVGCGLVVLGSTALQARTANDVAEKKSRSDARDAARDTTLTHTQNHEILRWSCANNTLATGGSFHWIKRTECKESVQNLRHKLPNHQERMSSFRWFYDVIFRCVPLQARRSG